MENILLILTLLVAGKLCSLLRAFPRETFKALSQFVIHVSLPALVLVKVRELSLGSEVLAPIVVPWVMLAIAAAIVLAVGRWLDWPRATVGALLLVIPLGNTSFVGVPLVEALLGREALPYVLVYDQLGSFLALATYGTIVVAIYGDGDEGEASRPRPTAAAIAWRIVTFPAFVALVVAFLCRGLTAPPAVEHLLARVADTLVPVVMFAVGFQFRFRVPRVVMQRAAFGLVLKMVAMPLLAYLGLLLTIGATHVASRTTVLEAGMPPQISAGAIAIAAGMDSDLVSSILCLGILLAPLTAWGLTLMF